MLQLCPWQPWRLLRLRSPRALPNRHLEAWLREEKSLTRKLAGYGSQLQVRPRSQAVRQLSAEDASKLGLALRQRAILREVDLFNDDILYFSARTLIPLSSLVRDTRRLRQWRNRSLGDFLFRSPRPERSPLEFACFLDGAELVWARRSIHYLYNRPIMVCEYFPTSSPCNRA